ncbi:MAG TPA: MFS transporter, partial [Candidatus Sulfotelmatobacter sp.]|nr:MFS transporter [Candidatus Sulfotelmatobacter sp.]
MDSRKIPFNYEQARLLAVLALINFVNFAARQVFVPLIPLLREHLHATDAQLGSLQTWLLVVLALASMPFGFFADRISRKAIIGVGIFFWSAATFAGGLVSSFVFFLIARALVGLGEAAYAPAAQSMISGAFPEERRALAQAIFASGMLLGGASGNALGGIIGPRYGWQAAFFIVAFAGVIPGLALFG